jgi:hypothetical protein
MQAPVNSSELLEMELQVQPCSKLYLVCNEVDFGKTSDITVPGNSSVFRHSQARTIVVDFFRSSLTADQYLIFQVCYTLEQWQRPISN